VAQQFEAARRYVGVVVRVLPTTAVVVADGSSGFQESHAAASSPAKLWLADN
jgi:hypothetical protein